MATSGDAAGKRAAARRLPVARIGLLLLALAAVIVLAREAGGEFPAFAARIEAMGAWGPLVFVLGYVIAVVAFVPAAPLTLIAGALFGIVAGTLYVLAAASLGGAAAFLISRYLARTAIERRLEHNPKFEAIDRAVADQGRKIVFLLRLSPVLPFNLLNYALGLTRVRFIDYAIASFGMLPGTLIYVYLGKLFGDVAALAGGAKPARSPAEYVLFGVGLLATVAVTVIVTRTARRALAEATGKPQGAAA
jgi:uncharacterized membrane protein YdjX (TVP38/TMEM64 family)